MKFEKMNDQQIRCTLTKEDLAEREIKISELAYGTEKARSLFRDMMLQAEAELDFEADDIPLMIEAVPINSECIVLTVTKVEDPEELDTRFAQFSPNLIDEEAIEDIDLPSAEQDNLLDMFKQIAKSNTGANIKKSIDENTNVQAQNLNLSRIFSISTLNELIDMAHVIASEYNGDNSIYKSKDSGKYLIVLNQSGMDLSSFNRVCNIISEYGESERSLAATSAYLDEHCEIFISSSGIQQLAQV